MATETKYPHGHHPTVLKSHLWRTLDNSCAYLLPHLKSTSTILDVGCGPGNLTVDLAQRCPQGTITGIDSAPDIVARATEHAQISCVSNVNFQVADVFKLPYGDGSFDIVHAHQVLQHLGDPTAALKEMRRVTKVGGIVAVRDMTHFLHFPETKELELFRDVFWKVAKRSGTVPGAGSMFRRFAREAGFKEGDMGITAGSWCFASREDLDWWCGMWADRVLLSEFRTNALEMGIVTEEDLRKISEAFTEFAKGEDSWYTVLHGELIATKS